MFESKPGYLLEQDLRGKEQTWLRAWTQFVRTPSCWLRGHSHSSERFRFRHVERLVV